MPGGRPTQYKPEFVEQVRKLALLGATDQKIADFFNVCETTIDTWKDTYPEFLGALKKAKADYDDNTVELSLRKRANGFMRTVERATKDGVVACMEEVPPDTTACIFWLKNRKPKEWRDKQEIEQVGTSSVEVNVITKSK
jgi:hypothetical protein